MTAETICIGHGRIVRLMTVKTGHRLAMFRMAFVTIHFGVRTGGLLHLLPRPGMTGDTSRPDIFHVAQLLGQRCMRVMAGTAVFNREMGLIVLSVAIGAGRQFPWLRRVLRVALGAVPHVTVGPPGLLDSLDNVAMATATEFGRLRCIDFDRLRRMSRMATEAVFLHHRFGMGFMAVSTLRIITMGQVALIAAEISMGIGHPLFNRDGVGVTGETDRFSGSESGKIDIQRFVRIMTGTAVGQTVMG